LLLTKTSHLFAEKLNPKRSLTHKDDPFPQGSLDCVISFIKYFVCLQDWKFDPDNWHQMWVSWSLSPKSIYTCWHGHGFSISPSCGSFYSCQDAATRSKFV